MASLKILIWLLFLSTAALVGRGPGAGAARRRPRSLRLWVALLALMMCPGGVLAKGGRPLGMGGAFIAVSDDENAVFYNPAGLSQVDRNLDQVSSQVHRRQDFRRDSFAHVGKIYQSSDKKKLTLEEYLETDYNFRAEVQRVSNYAFGFGALFERRSKEFEERIGIFPAAKDTADTYILAFATRFPIAEKLMRRPELYGGLRLRLTDFEREIRDLRSKVGQDLFDVDFSAFYRANSRFHVGATLDSAFADTTHRVFGARAHSTTVSVGTAYYYGEKRDTILAVDFTNIFHGRRAQRPKLRIGAERQFLDNDFVVRIGGNDGLLTLGFGVRFWEDFRLDYAFVRGAVLDEHQVSVRLNW